VSETSTDAKELVLDLLDTMGRGDLERLHDELLAEDATWTLVAPSLGAKPLEGRRAIVDFFAGANQVFEGGGGPKITIHRVVAEGDAVAVEASGTGPLVNGNTYDNRYHFAFDTRDGRVTAVREYMDSLHVVNVMPPPPA
jgi:ketosteroid isomerase-like protein